MGMVMACVLWPMREGQVMVKLKCPKCQSDVEIEDKDINGTKRTAVFCTDKDCFFFDNPLIGLSRDSTGEQEPGVYISESIL